METAPFSITPEGDSALTVRARAGYAPDGPSFVRAAAQALANTTLPAACEFVPAISALTVVYDPLQASFDQMQTAVLAALASLADLPTAPGRTVVVPTCYGNQPDAAAFGPDLPAVASHCGLEVNEVVRLHASRVYRIDMLGFMPGFPYLSGLDTRLNCPRLAVPRTSIPAGSVGIACNQTGIYPLSSPGGWRLIGRTPAHLFDPTRPEPVAYRAGDALRFEAIDLATFEQLANQEANGRSCLRFEKEDPSCLA